MSEEQKEIKPFVGSVGQVEGFNDKGSYNFRSGTLPAMKTQEVFRHYYEENKKDIEKTDRGRHKIPFVEIAKKEEWVDKSVDHPKTHQYLIGGYSYADFEEDQEHDTKLTDNIEI